MAYRSFSPSEFEARGARKVTTGLLKVIFIIMSSQPLSGYFGVDAMEESQDSSADWLPGLESSSDRFSSPLPLSQEVVEYTPKDAFILDEVFGEWRTIEDRLLAGLKPVKSFGWCGLVDKATNRQSDRSLPVEERKGYIQLSFAGINKVCSLCLLLMVRTQVGSGC